LPSPIKPRIREKTRQLFSKRLRCAQPKHFARVGPPNNAFFGQNYLYQIIAAISFANSENMGCSLQAHPGHLKAIGAILADAG
jgi:hypothetical protein